MQRVPHATCTACNVYRATCNAMLHATCTVQRAACNASGTHAVQMFDVQRVTCSMQRPTIAAEPAHLRPAPCPPLPHLHRHWARPLPHLHRDSAHRCFTGTGLTTVTSAPGLGSMRSGCRGALPRANALTAYTVLGVLRVLGQPPKSTAGRRRAFVSQPSARCRRAFAFWDVRRHTPRVLSYAMPACGTCAGLQVGLWCVGCGGRKRAAWQTSSGSCRPRRRRLPRRKPSSQA